MEGKIRLPKNARFSETHEWIKFSASKTKGKSEYKATIGITEYAVSKLGDLVHIELPNAGDKLEQGIAFGEIESIKTVAELYSLITGKVAEVNDDVKENLDLLKEDPYEDGWLIKVEFSDISEIDYLMDADAYKDYLQSLEPSSGSDTVEEDEDFFM